jgi:glycosyltransferase involved in cell wall biosynthesis
VNQNVAPTIAESEWEIPESDDLVYRAKQYSYALVIPVINEGERLKEQLRRIVNANLAIDVVIADGGSTDGSLDADFVLSAGVRAVLTKTGPGKLSAQLRVAYAWCIREGYVGIVTVDGNGKDGIEAISEMLAKLEQGYDYVQGSRYLPGGMAEHTPLERTIGNRLVHAPLLSIAGRYRYSDTTNGFRAYSSRYLLHPRVQPFREVFANYELLFYLTVRAGQLGMRITQIPVVRRYPKSGVTPTKITGLASKIDVFKSTLAVALRCYHP